MNKLVSLAKRLAAHSAVRNAALLYLVQISNFAFPLITLPYVSRVLGPSKLGLLVHGQLFIWYFYTLTEYGFDLTATRRVAIHKDDPAELSKIFSSVIVAKILLTLAGFAILMGSLFAIPKLRLHWELYLISFLTVLGGLFFPMWLYQGMEKLGWVALRDFAAKLAATVLVFLVVRQESDYLWVTAFQSGAMAAAGLVSLLMAPRVCGVRFTFPGWGPVWAELREGWSVFLSIAALSLTSTNMVVVGFFATEKEIGYYSGAFRVVVALRGLAAPIVNAVYPYVSHKASQSSRDAVLLLRKYALIPALPFLVGSVILFAAAPLVMQLLLGPKFGPTVPLLRIMAFSPFLMTIAHVYSTFFMLAFGYSKQWSRLILQSTVLNYVLLAILLTLVQPDYALAIAFTALDLYALGSTYWFYRKMAPTLMEAAN